MTDRYNALIVVLDQDYRDDDAEPILNAIRMVKGVLSVDGNVSNSVDYIAEQRVKRHFRQKLFEALE